MKIFLFFVLIGSCFGLHFPKIYQDGMVLQASRNDHPVSTIWGFLDGVRSNVTLLGNCVLNDVTFDIIDNFNPNKPVSFNHRIVSINFNRTLNRKWIMNSGLL